jgi:hypothetical protein
MGCSVTVHIQLFLRYLAQYMPPHIYSSRRKQMHCAKYCFLYRILYDGQEWQQRIVMLDYN